MDGWIRLDEWMVGSDRIGLDWIGLDWMDQIGLIHQVGLDWWMDQIGLDGWMDGSDWIGWWIRLDWIDGWMGSWMNECLSIRFYN